MTGHTEAWGEFVDVKINAPDLLRKEIRKKRKKGNVWISGVCDPYQPLESTYRLTRQCLEILIESQWPIVIQTRSPLVLRDIDILKNVSNLDLFQDAPDIEVGFSIPTADDSIRKLFEPHAPSIAHRVAALDQLHQAGIRTYAMIAPILPGAEGLGELLQGKIDRMLIDRMNYHYADWVFKKYGLEEALSPSFFRKVEDALTEASKKFGIEGYSVSES
jgi:DNA repair photolyase